MQVDGRGEPLLSRKLRPPDLCSWRIGDIVCTAEAFVVLLVQTDKHCCGEKTESRCAREIMCFSGFVFQTTEQTSSVLVMLFCGVSPMGESLVA